MLDSHPSSQPLHPLDYPIRSALTTRQRDIAEGDGLVWRYPVAIAPFAAMTDLSAASFAALHSLIAASDRVAQFTPEPVARPDEFEVQMAKTGEQMVGSLSDAPASGPEIVVLGPDDVPAMMELAELTKPGPFSARTHELGTFLGIRVGNQLAAMVGERMKLDGYTEITAAVAAIRPGAWPNLLILEFGDALLGRDGEIAAAAGTIYRRVLARDPEFGDQMIAAGRDREISAAYRETG
jgi:hypothetical protein